ncbi:MAG: hypothetical protein WBF17_25190 [Phycisphaerae bacterium]
MELGALPAQAVAAPRFSTDHHLGSFSQTPPRPGSLIVHRSVGEKVRNALRPRGHKLRATGKAIAAPVMLYMEPKSGLIYVAGDPAARRHAGALPERPGSCS